MRKNTYKVKSRVRSVRRLTATVVLVMVVLAIGAISVLSRQSGETGRGPRVAGKTQIVNARPASQDLHLEGQDAQPQALTPAEAQKLADGLKELVNQSTEGLVETQHADGTVSVDLDGRFQNVTVARINKDGSVAQSCVDNAGAAAAFFGIDPKLIDPTVNGPGSGPTKVSP